MNGTEPACLRWWEADRDGREAHSEAWAALRKIQGAQGYRREADRFHMALFSDLRYVGVQGYGGRSGSYELADLIEGRLNENVIKPIVMTLHAEITDMVPVPRFVSEGGSSKMQREAAKRDKWMAGLFYLNKMERLVREMAFCGLVTGTGAIKFFEGAEFPEAESTFTPELWVDSHDAFYGTPRTLYQARMMDRNVLMARHPDHEEEIERAVASMPGQIDDHAWVYVDQSSDSNMIPVLESWHLPSGPGAGDGRHILAIEGATLVDEEWTEPHFPFVFWRAEARPVGFWGLGVPEDLFSQQLEVNRVLGARQSAMHYLSAPYVLVEKGSKVVKSHLVNLIGRVVEYLGTPPQVIAPSTIASDVFTHGDSVKASMYDQRGVSMLTARAEKPAGLNAAVAIREYADQKSKRLIEPIRSIRDAVLEAGERFVALSRQMAAADGGLRARCVVDDEMCDIEWDESVDENVFRLKITDSSALSRTLAGKLQDMSELRDLGVVTDPMEMREMLPIPDLETFRKRQLARVNLCRVIVEERILGDGKRVPVPGYWPLELAERVALDALLMEEAKVSPSEHLDKLREFLSDIQYRKTERDQAQQALAASQAAGAPAEQITPGGVGAASQQMPLPEGGGDGGGLAPAA